MPDLTALLTTQLNIPAKPEILTSGSTSIEGYSYDASDFVLDVWFRGRRRSIYRFFLVYPVTVTQIFNSGPSVGLKARKILGGYRKVRLKG